MARPPTEANGPFNNDGPDFVPLRARPELTHPQEKLATGVKMLDRLSTDRQGFTMFISSPHCFGPAERWAALSRARTEVYGCTDAALSCSAKPRRSAAGGSYALLQTMVTPHRTDA